MISEDDRMHATGTTSLLFAGFWMLGFWVAQRFSAAITA
jgi:hypothetical protein